MANNDNTLDGKSLSAIAENDDLIQKFLIIHRFYLSPRISQLVMFYNYMISKEVFLPQDQDDAESDPVRLIRVGRFLDIVATKGPKGFRAFLDVLEYEYPHLFLHVTKEKPRDAPKGWRPTTPLSAGSVRIKTKMVDLISHLTQDAQEKSQINEQLQRCIMDAEEDHINEKDKLKKDLEEITGHNADLQEANRKYKGDVDELRRTSCDNRDTIERMRQEISVLTAQRRQDMAAIYQDRSKSLNRSTMTRVCELQKEVAKSKSGNMSVKSEELETLRSALFQEKNVNACIRTQISTLKETENQLLTELNERKEDYNRLVLEYSKKEKECDDLQNKLTYCEEETNYYQNKSCDLASEFNALLDAYQRKTEATEAEPIYRGYSGAPAVPADRDFSIYWKTNERPPAPPQRVACQVEPSWKAVAVPPLPPRVGQSGSTVPGGGKCVVVIHAPAKIQATLYEKLLKLPCQPGSGSANSRMFATVDMEPSTCTEADLQRGATNGKVVHYEQRPQGGFVMLSTEHLKQAIQNTAQHILLLMPPYKEFTIRIKKTGIKFIALLVAVEEQPESQLMRSLRANLTRQTITIINVPESQLADVDDLSKKLLNKAQEAINRNIT